MKNLIVLTDFPPFVGGPTIWYYRVCELLLKKNYNIFSLGGKGLPPQGVINLNPLLKKSLFIKITSLIVDLTIEAWYERKILIEMFRKGLLKWHDYPYLISYLLLIKRALPRLNFEQGFVLAAHANMNSLFGYMLCKRHGNLKLVIRCHGGGIIEFAEKRPDLVRFLLSQASYVNGVSKYLVKESIKKGADPDKVKVIYSARDIPKRINPNQKENIIIFCALLKPHKDPITYLRAVKKLVDSGHHLGKKFVVIGDGELFDSSIDYCRENKIDNFVEFTGSIPFEEVWSWMRKSKILVLPSLREPSGAVLTEAMGCKCYCIGTNVGGIPEIITPERGSLFDPGDYERLSQIINDYFKNEEKYFEKVETAYKYVLEEYSFEIATNQLYEIFESLSIE